MSGIHLSTLSRRGGDDDAFPFTVPAIRTLAALPLERVTFFVGENGSGKSTLLEGIAAAARLPTVGSADVPRDETLEAQRRLGKALRLSWNKKATRGFFVRAEDFFGFTKRLARERAELLMETQSQLALLAMIGDMVSQEAQFIIATHSPMLLAFPDARIYSFDATPVQAVAYEELDHVRLTRDFLNAPERYLNQIFDKTTPSSQRGEGARGEAGDGRGGYRIPIDTPI